MLVHRLCYTQEVPYQNSKVKGDDAELEVLLWLKKRGFSVAIPFGENQPYDLVIESPAHQLYRVQVRRVSWRNDVLEIPLRVGSKNYWRTLDLSRIDVFAVWDGEQPYFIRTELMRKCRATFSIRRKQARNKQAVGIRFADDFLDVSKAL